MLKKFSIILFISLFTLSAVGYPVFAHICTITGERTVFGCETCMDETTQVVQPVEESCCSTAPLETEVPPLPAHSSTVDATKCCFDTYDYKKIEDEFSPVLSLKVEDQPSLCGVITVEAEQEQNLKNYITVSENLPPPLSGIALLCSIHQLKIDTHLS